MTAQSISKLHNEIIRFESESTKCIPQDHYYIIKCTFKEPIKNIVKFAEMQLHSVPKPIAVYCSKDALLLIFPPLEGDEHHLYDGDISLIISSYVSIFVSEFNVHVMVRIISLTLQVEIFSYLSWVIHENTQSTFQTLSKGTITNKELKFKTQEELIKILKNQGVLWEDVDNFDKYGVLLKLGRKNTIIRLSEHFDARGIKQYCKIIF